MRRPQFTLSRLLLCTGLTGAGLGCVGVVSRTTGGGSGLDTFVLFLAAGPLTLAGLFSLFGLCRLGFYVGFFGQIIAVLTVFGFLAGWEVVVEHWSIRLAIACTAFVICLAVFVVFRKVRAARFRRSKLISKLSLLE